MNMEVDEKLFTVRKIDRRHNLSDWLTRCPPGPQILGQLQVMEGVVEQLLRQSKGLPASWLGTSEIPSVTHSQKQDFGEFLPTNTWDILKSWTEIDHAKNITASNHSVTQACIVRFSSEIKQIYNENETPQCHQMFTQFLSCAALEQLYLFPACTLELPKKRTCSNAACYEYTICGQNRKSYRTEDDLKHSTFQSCDNSTVNKMCAGTACCSHTCKDDQQLVNNVCVSSSLRYDLNPMTTTKGPSLNSYFEKFSLVNCGFAPLQSVIGVDIPTKKHKRNKNYPGYGQDAYRLHLKTKPLDALEMALKGRVDSENKYILDAEKNGETFARVLVRFSASKERAFRCSSFIMEGLIFWLGKTRKTLKTRNEKSQNDQNVSAHPVVTLVCQGGDGIHRGHPINDMSTTHNAPYVCSPPLDQRCPILNPPYVCSPPLEQGCPLQITRGIDTVQMMNVCDSGGQGGLDFGCLVLGSDDTKTSTGKTVNQLPTEEDYPLKSKQDITLEHDQITDQLLECWEMPRNDLLFYQNFSSMYHPATLGKLVLIRQTFKQSSKCS
ncbi:hypothetical protein, partial [Litorimonas sp.]|uniref:hypothetical protein n=1 Tax=Litorimonas sp. TaxID=1892381 RepID=UPI003A88EF7F